MFYSWYWFILNLVSNLLLKFASGLSFCAVMNKKTLYLNNIHSFCFPLCELESNYSVLLIKCFMIKHKSRQVSRKARRNKDYFNNKIYNWDFTDRMWTLITDKSFNKSSNKKIIFQNSYIFQHKVIIFLPSSTVRKNTSMRINNVYKYTILYV